jgi:hypothetical protein
MRIRVRTKVVKLEDGIGDAKNMLPQAIALVHVVLYRKFPMCMIPQLGCCVECSPERARVVSLAVRLDLPDSSTPVMLVQSSYAEKVFLQSLTFILQFRVYAKPPSSVLLRYKPESNLDTRMQLPPSFQ